MSHQRVPQQATPPVVRLRRTKPPTPDPHPRLSPPASLSISQTSSRLPRSAGIPPIRSVGSFRRVSWPCAAAGVSRFEILLVHPAVLPYTVFSSSLLQLLALQPFHPDGFDISAVIIFWEIFFCTQGTSLLWTKYLHNVFWSLNSALRPWVRLKNHRRRPGRRRWWFLENVFHCFRCHSMSLTGSLVSDTSCC